MLKKTSRINNTEVESTGVFKYTRVLSVLWAGLTLPLPVHLVHRTQ